MLKLSKKWSYAMKAVIYVANSWGLVHVSDISVSESIPESLLRRIIALLEKGSILKTIKWRNGWVMLGKDLNKISIYDVLQSAWEELGITDCTKWVFCDKQDNCLTTSFLGNLQSWFNALLKMYTLDKIINRSK